MSKSQAIVLPYTALRLEKRPTRLFWSMSIGTGPNSAAAEARVPQNEGLP